MLKNEHKKNSIIHSNEYSHYISLGYFCSISLELERLGLRDASYPIDWCISDFKGVVEVIENHFENFLSYDLLSQSIDYPEHYKNDKYNIQFFHDFDKYRSLEIQLKGVIEKYDRRIERFYKDVKEPTLFIRYISAEIKNADNKPVELIWIEENYDKIIRLIKSFNENNEIVFICNSDADSDFIKIYNVDIDVNDVVARRPFDKSIELKKYFEKAEHPRKKENLFVFDEKQEKKKAFLRKLCRKGYSYLKGIFKKNYIHSKRY